MSFKNDVGPKPAGEDAGKISELQGSMVQAAQGIPIPSHFRTEHRGSEVLVTNIRTGQSVCIGLCDYRGLRKCLNAFCKDRE